LQRLTVVQYMQAMPPDIYAALLTTYEAVRQAGRGKYTPDDDVRDALALLLKRGSDRAPYVALWQACNLDAVDVNPTTANHERGQRARAAWLEIAGDVGVDLTPELMARLHADARVPDERHIQAKSVARWKVR
jgi:hypothetical protein